MFMAKDLLELTYNSKNLTTELEKEIVDAVIEVVRRQADKDKYVISHRYGYKDMDDGLDALDDKYGEDALIKCMLYSSFFNDDPDYLYDVAMLQLTYLKEMGIIDLKAKDDLKGLCTASSVMRKELEDEIASCKASKDFKNCTCDIRMKYKRD